MCAKPLKKEPRQVETTGHSWDGIEEYNNPLPRWWVWVFYATIVWGIGYTVAYPAWPLISQATPGLLGASTRADVEVEIAAVDKANAAIKDKLVAADLTAIGSDSELANYAERAGAAVFKTNCAQCHGSGAAGVEGKGYPNLLDDDWLWGGTMEDIHTTVTHGIRNTTDGEARYSEMPKFGLDGILDENQ
ncbi:MAG TPA: cytochrome-c oxidase, cbb3-type subunit III, partial [Tabrizicola sp.]